MLSAQSPLEARIITSFLRAADYEALDLDFSRPEHNTLDLHPADIGIILLENADADIQKLCRQVREAGQSQNMPIIAIVPEEAVQDEDGLFFLVRPIRLFELVDALRSAMRLARSAGSQNANNFQNVN